jgi:hypothetical protein
MRGICAFFADSNLLSFTRGDYSAMVQAFMVQKYVLGQKNWILRQECINGRLQRGSEDNVEMNEASHHGRRADLIVNL